ncbi:Molybdopterin synthase catalytic subunit [Blyttiomyces sp. JEL0837]|nr:Molybdopterin synthase catalytic subunit [Blyttiomyces sp. JEL0837]
MTNQHTTIAVGPDPINLQDLVNKVRDDGCGAISTFSGTTRDYFVVNGIRKRVLRLEYSAYVPMAIKELEKLSNEARKTWPSLHGIAITHRIGVVPVGEESVVIAISSPHRKDAIEAVGWCIDELKRTVPVWKLEVYEDGSQWKSNSECCGV